MRLLGARWTHFIDGRHQGGATARPNRTRIHTMCSSHGMRLPDGILGRPFAGSVRSIRSMVLEMYRYARCLPRLPLDFVLQFFQGFAFGLWHHEVHKTQLKHHHEGEEEE